MILLDLFSINIFELIKYFLLKIATYIWPVRMPQKVEKLQASTLFYKQKTPN